KGIFASGNYAFVAGGSLGLAVINVSNPNNITVSDTLTPAGTPDFTNVFVKGNEALATDSASGNSNLYIADVTDPQNISFARNYPTPYTYFDIYVKGNYSFMPIDLGIVSVDIYDGPKLSNLKKSATDFVDFPGWTFPPDQMGLVSYSNFASLDAPLSSNPVPTKTGIANLVASGQTDVAPGINRAKNELTGATANPNALKFIILLGDGKENPGQGGEGQPSLNAAQQAADNNITIYTIGFGADADANLLTQIANIGKGKYYQANDKNALSEVFLIIANEITKSAQDANILVPSFGGAVIVDAGEGIIIDQNLLFDIGELAAGASWTSTYTLQFPCSDQNNCGIDAITLPGEGTQFTYTDSNGFVHTIDFNAQVTLDFLKRDLKVDIISGTVVSDDEVYLDVTVQNVAELDANAVDLNFFLNDLNGPFLTQATVPPLCSLETAGCTENSTTFNSVFISNSGKIYATIGDGTEIRECPADNTDAVFCGTGSPAQFIEMKYYLWRK
ncbi:MAG: VWA domain-containing protein, partial [Candidatus Diapherotrites archaeon]|nr:VWA domain-containing protein [Candidatus Diapherotrites archaeon]